MIWKIFLGDMFCGLVDGTNGTSRCPALRALLRLPEAAGFNDQSPNVSARFTISQVEPQGQVGKTCLQFPRPQGLTPRTWKLHSSDETAVLRQCFAS